MPSDRNVVVLYYPADDEGFAWHPFCYQRIAPELAGAGFQPIVIDQRVMPDWQNRLESVVHDALWVGFSVISGVMIKYSLEAARILKSHRPDLPVVFGGWHPTCLPRQTLSHPLVDYVAVGAGEELSVRLSAHIKRNGAPKPERVFGKGDLSSLPDGPLGFEPVIPKTSYDWRLGYRLIPDMNLYRSERNVVSLFSAISCPYSRCTFCSIVSMYRFRAREVEDTLDEIAFLRRECGFTSINFHDGLFFVSPKVTMPLVRGMKERGLGTTWKAKSRANGLTRFSHEDLTLLKETGLKVVAVGLESGSARMLEKMQKGTRPEDAESIVKMCHDYGIEIQTTYISGLPGETVDDLKLTIEQIERLKTINPRFYFSSFFYLPAPGTQSCEEFVETGGWIPDSLEGWSDVKWRRLNDINKLHWLSSAERREFLRVYHDYFSADNPAKRVGWSHDQKATQ